MKEEDFKKLSEEEKQIYIDSVLQRNQPQERQPFITTGFPQRFGQFFAALLGLPVERYRKNINHPFMIFFFILIMLAAHIYSTSIGIEAVVKSKGFIPELWYRGFLTTFISSFFLHGSWMHFLGNAYYFYVFGDDVEDDMNPLSFVLLLFGGHIFGILLHAFLSGSTDLPLVGASAGISALLGYYMIRFPKRQISYMIFFFYVWIHIPAVLAFVWKFLWELSLVTTVGGIAGVAHWAHLGGALVGVVFALVRKKQVTLMA